MRIEPRSEESCPWYLKPFFWRQRRKYGKALDAELGVEPQGFCELP